MKFRTEKNIYCLSVILIMLCIGTLLKAQNTATDSLQKHLKISSSENLPPVIEKTDTAKIKALFALSLQFLATSNFDRSIAYAEQTRVLAEKIASSPIRSLAKFGKRYIANYHNQVGMIYRIKS